MPDPTSLPYVGIVTGTIGMVVGIVSYVRVSRMAVSKARANEPLANTVMPMNSPVGANIDPLK